MKKTVTIAVCGSQPRIGATTQALQIVAYLQMMGYLAAYIALDGSDYINNMQKLYQGVTEDKSCIIYERICLYQSVTEPKTEDEEYEFLVKDYGAMSLSTFNRVSFLEQDIQVICAGVKPNEVFVLNDILKRPEFNDVKFIFSFVPHDQKEGVLSMMTKRADNTFFANYNPDPFAYDATMNKSYRLLIGERMAGTSGEKQRRGIGYRWRILRASLRQKRKNVFESPAVRGVLLVVYTFLIGQLFYRM